MQLAPQEYFTIVRQLADHTDASTYYVKATIRNAMTDEVIAVLNLTNKGNGRFSQRWQVVADTSGMGFYIAIITEVYTDSGYTTKAQTYGDESSTYLVQSRAQISFGSGGATIDYKKLKKLIEEVVEQKVPKLPETKPISFNEVLGAISKAKDDIIKNMPEIPPQDPVDLLPIMEALEMRSSELLASIQAIPARDKNEIQPFADALSGLDLESMKQDIRRAVEDFHQIIDGMRSFSESTPEMQEKLTELHKDFKDILYTMSITGTKAKGEQTTTEKKDTIDPKFARLAAKLRK